MFILSWFAEGTFLRDFWFIVVPCAIVMFVSGLSALSKVDMIRNLQARLVRVLLKVLVPAAGLVGILGYIKGLVLVHENRASFFDGPCQ